MSEPYVPREEAAPPTDAHNAPSPSEGTTALPRPPPQEEVKEEPPTSPKPKAPLTSPWTPHDMALAFFSISVMAIAGVGLRIHLGDETKAGNFFRNFQQSGPNFLGSFLMGVFQSDSLKAALPYTHVGLTVGLCGCLTTFSSWVYNAVKAGDTYKGFLVEVIVGMTTPFMVFFLGRDVGALLPPIAAKLSEKNWFRIDMAILVIVLCLEVPLIRVYSLRDDDIVPCCLGPIGAMLRYVLVVNLNPIQPKFQIGTFVANLIAVCIVGALEAHPGKWSKYVTTGFCGSLSTVSSWVNETVRDYQQSKAWAYFYCVSSVVVGIAVAKLAIEVG